MGSPEGPPGDSWGRAYLRPSTARAADHAERGGHTRPPVPPLRFGCGTDGSGEGPPTAAVSNGRILSGWPGSAAPGPGLPGPSGILGRPGNTAIGGAGGGGQQAARTRDARHPGPGGAQAAADGPGRGLGYPGAMEPRVARLSQPPPFQAGQGPWQQRAGEPCGAGGHGCTRTGTHRRRPGEPRKAQPEGRNQGHPHRMAYAFPGADRPPSNRPRRPTRRLRGLQGAATGPWQPRGQGSTGRCCEYGQHPKARGAASRTRRRPSGTHRTRPGAGPRSRQPQREA
jgi:hypothetical protein